jgi:hypothetical protein
MKQIPVWIGGNGNIEHMTVARDEGEAINNLIEMEPILRAIGAHAEKLGPVDGCEIVALAPDRFEFGDTRRNKVAKKEKVEDILD